MLDVDQRRGTPYTRRVRLHIEKSSNELAGLGLPIAPAKVKNG